MRGDDTGAGGFGLCLPVGRKRIHEVLAVVVAAMTGKRRGMDYEKMSDRELDVEIASKVMKLDKHPDGYWLVPVYKNIVPFERIHPPEYSKSLIVAFTVVEQIKALIPDGIFTMMAYQKENYAAGFIIPQAGAAPTSYHWVEAPTLPRAICIAALKSITA